MTSIRWIGIALALSATTLLTGCQTAQDTASAESRIRINKGAYQGEASPLGGDIKSILMAGGLDITNPSSPTGNTSKAEIGKTMASSTETLVAALSDVPTRSASAAQTMKPDTKSPASIMVESFDSASKPNAQPSKALALVEEKRSKPKPVEREKKVVYEIQIEHQKDPLVELASINATDSKVFNDYAFDPVPETSIVHLDKPQVAGIKQEAPLPTTKVEKRPRDANVAIAAPTQKSEVLEKKSRVRRF